MKLKNNRNKIDPKDLSLCFVGNMLGQNAGYITTQGEIVADLFAAEGHRVTRVSSRISRTARIAEIVAALIKRRRDFDIVILDVYSGLNLIMAEIAGLLCKAFGLTLIMVLHGGDLPNAAERSRKKLKRILGRADFLIAPSRFLAEKIGSLGFEIKVIPNVLDIERCRYRARSKIRVNLLWMRSFHPIYNPQMAIKVLAELKKNFPEATLTMAGVDKGLEDEVKKMAADLELKDAVRFPGFLDAEKKREEFERADIFINTNRVDNMPVAVIEACAYGLPVVATEVGGLPYLLSHGENGLLVPNEDIRAMAEKIEYLIGNPDAVSRLSANGRQLAERSAWENVRQKWEELFVMALSHKEPVESSASLTEREFTTDKT